MSLKHLLLAAISTATVAFAASADTYNGNGATGFGGPLGNGSLTITNDASNLYFTFNTGANNNDFLVVHIDSVAGGLTSTAGVDDFGDQNRGAISAGLAVNYPPSTAMDYAISTPGAGTNSNFAGLWQLASPVGNNGLPFGAVANIGGTQNATTFNIPLASIGLGSGGTFQFVATYAAGSGYLSNESIPGSTTIVDPNDGSAAPNAGNGGSVNFTIASSYNAVVPEPTTVGALAIGGLLLARRRK